MPSLPACFPQNSSELTASLGTTCGSQSISHASHVRLKIDHVHCAISTLMKSLIPYRSEDDLTHKLNDIIKANNKLRKLEETGVAQHIIKQHTELLQFHVTTYIDNTKPGQPVAQQRGGKYISPCSPLTPSDAQLQSSAYQPLQLQTSW